MTTESKKTAMAWLVGLLAVVVVVQSVVVAKLYQKSGEQEAEATDEAIQMDIRPKAAAGPSSATNVPKWNPQFPLSPSFGGLGYNPGPWDPFQEFRSMRQQMDQMFNDSFGRFRQSPDFEPFWGEAIFAPSMDVEEKKDSYIVRMDIPGVDKSNISIEIADRELRVSGKIEETLDEETKHHLRKERRCGEFRRTLTLPGPVKADEMQARYDKGVLAVTIPKASGQGSSRHIEVK